MTSMFSVLLLFCWVGAAIAQCGSNQGQLEVTIQYDSNPGETTASLTNTATSSTVTLPISQIAGTAVSYSECVQVNTLYKVSMNDSGGNGIGGNGYATISINGRLIATVSDFGSEVSYYFSAGGQVCSNPRFILDVKYDSNPAGVSAALTAGGNLQFSLTGLNTAALANQFVAIDRCVAAGSYIFSITAAGGISSPGFYRIFSEDTLLAVGGGDNGFKGTDATSFTVTDGPVPTPAPTPDVCDDAWETKFLDLNGLLQNCIWLQNRPEEVTRHCQPGLPAYTLCEETCGSCTDTCPPDDDTKKFDLAGGSNRNCEYIRVRLSANFNKYFPMFCDPADNGYVYCTESCENCEVSSGNEDGTDGDGTDGDGTDGDGTDGDGSDGDGSDGDGSDGDGGNTDSATPTPTPDPLVSDPCDDSKTTLIFISELGFEVSCRYLATTATAAQKATYCASGHVSGAFDTCAETCGKCTDDCEDTVGGTITDNNNDVQTCDWVAANSARVPIYCFPGSEAWDVCKEACGNCN